MKRAAWSILVSVALMMAACSSAETADIEFATAMGSDGTEVSGPAVEDGMVCSRGTWDGLSMENADGESVSDEEGAVIWDDALESGATVEMFLTEEFTCDDGSGSIRFEIDNVVQPSTVDFDGRNDVGTWTIASGTGDYDGYTGDGTYIADFGEGFARLSGEITRP